MSTSAERRVLRDAKKLVGLQVARVRYMTDEECGEFFIGSRGAVIVLSDGTALFAMADDEGNDAGAVFARSSDGQETILPRLDR